MEEEDERRKKVSTVKKNDKAQETVVTTKSERKVEESAEAEAEEPDSDEEVPEREVGDIVMPSIIFISACAGVDREACGCWGAEVIGCSFAAHYRRGIGLPLSETI